MGSPVLQVDSLPAELPGKTPKSSNWALKQIINFMACKLYLNKAVKKMTVIYQKMLKNISYWTSLAVHWLRLHAANAGVTDLISSQQNKIANDEWCGQNKKNSYILAEKAE